MIDTCTDINIFKRKRDAQTILQPVTELSAFHTNYIHKSSFAISLFISAPNTKLMAVIAPVMTSCYESHAQAGDISVRLRKRIYNTCTMYMYPIYIILVYINVYIFEYVYHVYRMMHRYIYEARYHLILPTIESNIQYTLHIIQYTC